MQFGQPLPCPAHLIGGKCNSHRADVRAEFVAEFLLRRCDIAGRDTDHDQATQIHVAGWAFDPDVATQPWRVSIYLGGTYGHAFKSVSVAADHSRPDVAAAYPGAGAAHGFDLNIEARPGTYPVCAYAPDDCPYGAGKLIGCITVTV